MSHRVGDRRFSPYQIPRSKISITSESYTILSLFFFKKGFTRPADAQHADEYLYLYVSSFPFVFARLPCQATATHRRCGFIVVTATGIMAEGIHQKYANFFSFSSSFICERKDMWDAVPLVLSQSRHVIVTGAGVGYIRDDVKQTKSQRLGRRTGSRHARYSRKRKAQPTISREGFHIDPLFSNCMDSFPLDPRQLNLGRQHQISEWCTKGLSRQCHRSIS